MDKFGRNYLLLVEKTNGETLEIQPPFTVEFDIHRNSFSSANVCSIRIYNLSPNNRNQITKDQFDTLDNRTIEFRAGYGDNLSIAFKGMITQAWSVREGTNFITQIESYDGGFAYLNAVTDAQFPAGTPNDSIIDTFAADLEKYGVSKGVIAQIGDTIPRGNAYSGSTTEIMREYTNGSFYIDNSKCNVIGEDQCIDGSIPVINSQSGLLGTPLKENQYITFEMIFEPGLKIGQLIEIQSEGATRFNGTHKVVWLKHTGMISDAVCGNAITSVGVLSGSFTPVGG